MKARFPAAIGAALMLAGSSPAMAYRTVPAQFSPIEARCAALIVDRSNASGARVRLDAVQHAQGQVYRQDEATLTDQQFTPRFRVVSDLDNGQPGRVWNACLAGAAF